MSLKYEPLGFTVRDDQILLERQRWAHRGQHALRIIIIFITILFITLTCKP